MKGRGKKGQASLEYLLVYGFGILMVIVSLVLAWQSGIFTKSPSQDKGRGGFSQLTIDDFTLQGNSFNLTLKNNAPDLVKVKGINATLEYKADCFLDKETDLAPGDKTVVALNCTDLKGKYPPGQYYKANIIIEYLNIRSNNLHRSQGYIWGTVE